MLTVLMAEPAAMRPERGDVRYHWWRVVRGIKLTHLVSRIHGLFIT
jgi:hypothetical protein